MSADELYVIGTGTLATAIALKWRAAGGSVIGAWSRSAWRREWATEHLGLAVAPTIDEVMLERAGWILVGVRDDALVDVATRLQPLISTSAERLWVHLSGALPAAVLDPTGSARVGSLHPVVAASDVQRALVDLEGAAAGIEGAVDELTALARRLGLRPFVVDEAAKDRYHAAVVLASNLVVALLDVAIDVLPRTVERDDDDGPRPNELLGHLAAQVAKAVAERGTREALTGPVVRGDVATLRRHLAVLGPEPARVYRALSTALLPLARERGLSDVATAACLQALLSPTPTASLEP